MRRWAPHAGTPPSGCSGWAPVTGAPVNGEEIHKEELRGGDLLPGGGKVTAFAGHVKMREDYVDSTVALVTSQRTLVLLLTSYLPWASSSSVRCCSP